MELVRTGSYSKGIKRLKKLGASSADITAMEDAIAADIEIGATVADTGGMRKVRFGFGNIGKRGGGRTIYYAVTENDVVYLIVTYAKVDKGDLTADEKRLFRDLIEELTDG